MADLLVPPGPLAKGELWAVLEQAVHNPVYLTTGGIDSASYMRANPATSGKSPRDPFAEAGLTAGHAYTVLKTITATGGPRGQKVRLVQIRNPWANATEWSGDWSDKSDLWQQYPEVARQCGWTELQQVDDGIYWMSWRDTLQWFNGGGSCVIPKNSSHWRDVRWQGRLVDWQSEPDETGERTRSGLCEFVVELTLKKQCDQGICFSVYQPDTRGQDPKKKQSRKQAAVRICLLRRPPNIAGDEEANWEMLTENWSHPYEDPECAGGYNGEFMKIRDVMLQGAKELGDDGKQMVCPIPAGTHYYVVQGNPDEEDKALRTQQVTLCLHCPRGIGTVRTVQTTSKMHKSCAYEGMWGFLEDDPAPFSASAMQVDGKDVSADACQMLPL